MIDEKPKNPKKDIVFILSLVFILFFAVYLYFDHFKGNEISPYLRQTGTQLMAGIIDEQQKQHLSALYDELLGRVDKREISPTELEIVTSRLLNLQHIHKDISPQDFEILLKSTLENAIHVDTLKDAGKSSDKNNWVNVTGKIKTIYNLDKSFRKIFPSGDVAVNNEGRLPIVIDDSLNVIIDKDYEKKMLALSDEEQKRILKELEINNRLKWQNNLEKNLRQSENAIEKNMMILEKRLSHSKAIRDSLNSQMSLSTKERFKSVDSLNAKVQNIINSILSDRTTQVTDSLEVPKVPAIPNPPK